jgi:hypothetical protein
MNLSEILLPEPLQPNLKIAAWVRGLAAVFVTLTTAICVVALFKFLTQGINLFHPVFFANEHESVSIFMLPWMFYMTLLFAHVAVTGTNPPRWAFPINGLVRLRQPAQN